MTGPINYLWLNGLEATVRSLAPVGGARAIACKVALQSLVLQPFIYLPSFLTVSACMRGWRTERLLEE
jgi:hypothetical protein